ncbi:DNA-3-methyladenine glycosylase I [Pelosinus propionicus]|uniref:DNA-3-methyladenine glycosylase I n=1 Tax=Pelosinus propionicus DSM 13327 TaxID=1123291 RepID=A0A1I4J157_9FIRM|nr:DNA-3-methyladenine glycosylase I [Pelosinus propionicus]SFL60315.1 DNA-3-methyladenine glycosylase I [Pelosinus propionicus DSM 13327]
MKKNDVLCTSHKIQRCGWVTSDALYQKYHDTEWGVPQYDDDKLFEFLLLEGLQAGLSWITILKRREVYREVLDGFLAAKIAVYDEEKMLQLMSDPRLIRNSLKMTAIVKNAKAFLQVQQETGSFSTYIWQFIGGMPKINRWSSLEEVPTETLESKEMSRALKKRGFSFVGPTICYAYMQAIGMVNDHIIHCYRHKELLKE